MENIQGTILSIVALMVAIIGHEIFHGLAALAFGDKTAKNQGRLSPNPIRHIDPVGTLLIPALLFVGGSPFMFGWAKPVPVNSWNVISRGGYLGMVVVSLAGIFFNFAFAFAVSLLISSDFSNLVNLFLLQLILYNILLALFNLTPIPPLDGAQAISNMARFMGIRPIYALYDFVGNYGMIIMIGLLYFGFLDPIFQLTKTITFWLIL